MLWLLAGAGASRVPDLGLATIPWEGGAAYYAQFPKADAAGWSDPTFFPIGVFLAPTQAPYPEDLLAAGLNVYFGVEHNTPLTLVTGEGMHAVPQMEEWTTGDVSTNALAVGWLLADEPDMNEDFGDEDGRLAEVEDRHNTIRALDDGRFTFLNIGNGVNRTFWCPNTIDEIVQTPDVCSVDQYTYTSYVVQGNVEDSGDWPGGSSQCAASYGWLADQMYSFQGATRKPFYVTIETKFPYLAEDDADIILYAQIEGAVWAALIHEARGIIYFQHNGHYDPGPAIDPNTGIAPDTSTYSITDCEPGLTAAITAINAKVASLAPVLNTQSRVHDYGATGIDTMTKIRAGELYVFAHVALGGTTGSKTFTLPAGVGGETAVVEGESRSVAVTAGEFTDTFANEYTHHVYRVTI